MCLCYICITISHAEFLMIMASGPFSTLDSLEYSTLKELLEVVKQDRPSILVLVCTHIYWSNKPCRHFHLTSNLCSFDFCSVVHSLIAGILLWRLVILLCLPKFFEEIPCSG